MKDAAFSEGSQKGLQGGGICRKGREGTRARDAVIGRAFEAKRTGDADGDITSEGTAPKIIIVDDHPLVRDGIVALIRAATGLRVSAEAGNAEEAWVAIEKDVPDLVVLDLGLPDRSGIDLLKDIHGDYPAVRVLVLSMHEESVYAERALRAGANGYVMKCEPGFKVIEAIRNILRGEIVVSPAVAAQMLRRFVANRPEQVMRGNVGRLSDRELQVFSEIGKGLSTREIALACGLNVKTVQTYREQIKRKLGLRNATELIHFATHWVGTEEGLNVSRPTVKKGVWSSPLSAM